MLNFFFVQSLSLPASIILSSITAFMPYPEISSTCLILVLSVSFPKAVDIDIATG